MKRISIGANSRSCCTTPIFKIASRYIGGTTDHDFLKRAYKPLKCLIY
jgi:hypothetical protein